MIVLAWSEAWLLNVPSGPQTLLMCSLSVLSFRQDFSHIILQMNHNFYDLFSVKKASRLVLNAVISLWLLLLSAPEDRLLDADEKIKLSISLCVIDR